MKAAPTLDDQHAAAKAAQLCQTCQATGRRGYCAAKMCVCNHPPCPAYESSRRAQSEAAAVALAAAPARERAS